MNNWELARYFIDAKKCVDTMLYLAENAEAVSMIDIREKVTETRRKFYINSCVVLDKSFPKDKKAICQDEIIDRIYYERDKNSAHKDEKYHASLIKHGLKIPRNTINYQDFEINIKDSEIEFMKLFNMVGGKKV